MSIFDKIRGVLRGDPSEAVAMISCEEALQLVHDYLDGELEGAPSSEVQQHFEACQRCYPHLHLETVFRSTLQRAAGPVTAPPGLKERIAALLAESADGE